MRFDVGAVFAGYTVVSRLGRGGMATVYLVREPGINRLVALKVLPEQLADDAQFAERFEQEAQVIGGLDHPSIMPLYRYGITDHIPWMALRYVDGGDLAARLMAGPLSVPDGLSMLRAIAAALDYAHRKGVIHRDLKPQNVLLTSDGAAYLADFGIAKLLEGAGKLKTATGGILGTPTYMAPEQAQGFRLGPYTDVYALAVICFQWLTGSVPFDGDTPHAVLFKHVSDPVPAELLAVLPPAVAAVLVRGLAKQPEHRIQSTSALITELERALTAPVTGWTDLATKLVSEARAPTPAKAASTTAPSGPSAPAGAASEFIKRWKAFAVAASIGLALLIAGYAYRNYVPKPVANAVQGTEASSTENAAAVLAVLPMTLISDTAGDAAFSDGLHEEILASLARYSRLQSISRTTMLRYRGGSKSVREIATDLGATHVLEGSIRRDGAALRLSFQLIDARGDSPIWTERLEVTAPFDFSAQQSRATTVARAVGVMLDDPYRFAPGYPTTQNTAALGLYAQARAKLRENPWSEDALSLLEAAVELDPAFAQAHATIARVSGDKSRRQRALEIARRLQPELPEAHIAEGRNADDAKAALAAFDAAALGAPRDTELHRGKAYALRRLGRFDDALAEFKQLVAADPLDWWAMANVGLLLTELRRYDEAVAYLERQTAIWPRNLDLDVQLMSARFKQDGNTVRLRDAISKWQLKHGLDDEAAPVKTMRIQLAFLEGDFAGARALLDSYPEDQLYGVANLIVGDGSIAWQKMWLLVHAGQAKEAAGMLSAQHAELLALREKPDAVLLRVVLALNHALSGNRTAALAELELFTRDYAKSVEADQELRGLVLIANACVYAWSGEPERAIAAIAEGLEIPFGLHASLLARDPIWRPLHGEPKFRMLLAERGFPLPEEPSPKARGSK